MGVPSADSALSLYHNLPIFYPAATMSISTIPNSEFQLLPQSRALRYLQILNLVFFAAACTMTLVLAVVCLLLAVYLDSAHELGVSLMTAVTATAYFLLWAIVAGVAVWGIHRDALWKWFAQAGMFAVIAYLAQHVSNLG